MTALDRVLPTPRLLETDCVDLALPCERAWALLRHGDLGRYSALTRLLFAVRTLGKEPVKLAIDDLRSTPDRPGFQVLVDDPPHEVVVGAIGKVYQPKIPFRHVASADAFAAAGLLGEVKVAWAIRLVPLGAAETRVEIEVRVDAADHATWRKFRRYFALIGPFSRFIRRSLLASLAREHGTASARDDERALPGDDLLADAGASVTQSIVIGAAPHAIWPWLVQMGGGRAGFYSADVLDNGGKRSAREIHPELQSLRVGDIVPAAPRGKDGFEVLRLEPDRCLVLGGLFDTEAKRQLPFRARRPEGFWHVVWAFSLEPLDADHTRLSVRARAAFPAGGRLRAWGMERVHRSMEAAQLRNLALRAEGRLPRDDWRDVLDGLSGAAIMAAGFATPFLRGARSHWGLDAAAADRAYPGDAIVAKPKWSWTHGIEIDAPPDAVWPWVAQIGADRGGFYSYQWLENLAGCRLRNAERVHPEWSSGAGLLLHPGIPALDIAELEAGRWFVAHAPAARGETWVETTWLFFVEPLPSGRTRFISRYRCACSNDFATRLQFGPTLIEPIGFAMDRRMLMGLKARAERGS